MTALLCTLALLAWPVLISANPVVVQTSAEVTDDVTEAVPEVVVRLVPREQSRSPLNDHAALPAQQDLQSRTKKSPYCVQVHSDHPNEPAYEVCGQKIPVEPHSHSGDYDAGHNLANAAIASASAPSYGHQASSYGTAPQPSSYGHPAPQPSSYGGAPQPSSYGTVPQPSSYGGAPQPSNYGTLSHQAASYNTAPQAASYGTPAHAVPVYGTSNYGGAPSYTVTHAAAPHNYAPLAPSHVTSSYTAYPVPNNFPAPSGYAASKPSATYFSNAQVPHTAYAGTYQPITSSHPASSYNAPVSTAPVSSSAYKDDRISLMPSYTSYGTQKIRSQEDTKKPDKNETTSRASEYDSSSEHSQDCKFPLKFVGYISSAPKSEEAYEPASEYEDPKPQSAGNYGVEYPPKPPVNYASNPYGNKGYAATYPYGKPLPYPSYLPPAYSYQPKPPVTYAPPPYNPPQYVYPTTHYVSYPAPSTYGAPPTYGSSTYGSPPTYGAPAPVTYGPGYYKSSYSTSIPLSIACQVIPTPQGHDQAGYTQSAGYGRNAAPIYTCVVQDKSDGYRDDNNKQPEEKKMEETQAGSTKPDQKSSEESDEEKQPTTNHTTMESSTRKVDVEKKEDEGKPPMKKPQEPPMQHPIQQPSVPRMSQGGHQMFPPPPFPQYGPEYYSQQQQHMNHGHAHSYNHPPQKMK